MNSAGRKHRRRRGASQQSPPHRERLWGRNTFRHIWAKIKRHLWEMNLPARRSYELVLANTQPHEIKVKEQYCYEFKLTGVQYREFQKSEGRIEVVIPYDGQHDIVPSPELEERLQQRSQQKPVPIWGELEIVSFGNSRLNEQFVSELEERRLSFDTDFEGQALEMIRSKPKGRFDIRLSQSYQPAEPEYVPAEIPMKAFDEEEIKEEQELKVEVKVRNRGKDQPTPALLLVQDVTDHASFKSSLCFRFQVIVSLPGHYVQEESDDKVSVRVSHMTMDWPIATVPSQPRLKIGSANNKYKQVPFNPVRGALEWFDIPLKRGKDGGFYFESDEIWLEVDEPGEVQNEQILQGKVNIEVKGLLLSGLQLSYKGRGHATISKQSIMQVDYRIKLRECFEDKRYSPQQHLQFPGIVLDEFRLADVLMLLKDKRFEVTQPFTERELAETHEGSRQYLIKATRAEGAGELLLWMLIRGTPSATIRERETKGNALYRTQLPTGTVTIYMHGGLKGDKQRAIQILNELHQQLKQHFRYVGTVD